MVGFISNSAPSDADEDRADLPTGRDGVGAKLRDAHRAYNRLLQARLAEEGVTLGMWYFLCALWQEDGISQRQLSRRVGTMEPTTVSALAQMERRGLVQRQRDPMDQRRRVVRLTRVGKSLQERLQPLQERLEAPARLGLSEAEAAQLLLLLDRVTDSLERTASS
ncbi:MarR family winged helix-turn-helix transcriptional regulator [Algihabitans albus]|uniref:MarR family winged helix-turn-helix transcriptional regulator n=1 Tax=Algihabitans albus TaxID=2164067 RepID=UPI000E5C9103|nr:MarR family transcriptional regulator [Algihabitans albus]